MATANVRFNGHSVRLNAGECDGSEALTYLVPNEGAHEIRDAADAERLFGKYSAAYDLAMRGLAAVEPDDTLRTRLARECASEVLYRRVLTATGAELDALAEKYGLARTSPVAPKTKDAAPTLRIFDATGCVLAEGPVHAERTEKGARLRFAGQCCATGTAECYAVYANGKQVTWGQMGRGVRPLHMAQALSSGLYLTITLDVIDASEEQMQALGLGAAPSAVQVTLRCTECSVMRTMPLPDVGATVEHRCTCGVTTMLRNDGDRVVMTGAAHEGMGAPFAVALGGVWSAKGPTEERRQREAALVALVNAVPDGLNATGWRAAVLAVEERRLTSRALSHHESAAELCAKLRIADILRLGKIARDEDGFVQHAALDAYQRAIAPHKAPAPERRRGGKAVRLTVDDGRDDS